jgi:hypothetical protein
MRAIPVTSEQEFERLLEDLSVEAARAVDPWRLLKGLDAALDDYVTEINQTPAFWQSRFVHYTRRCSQISDASMTKRQAR